MIGQSNNTLSAAANTIPARKAYANNVTHQILQAYDHFQPDAPGQQPGRCVVVVDSGSPLLVESYGYSDIGNSRPMTPDTRVGLASSSKIVTCIILGELIADGRVDWDAHVQDLVPWFESDVDKRLDAITVRDVFHHTSGLPAEPRVIDYGTNTFGDEAAIRAVTRSLRLVSEPGSKFNYSEYGYVLLQAAIESVTGKTFEEVFRQEIVQRLGLMATSLSVDRNDPQLANYYGRFVRGGRKEYDITAADPGESFSASQRVFTTGNDLAKLLPAIFDIAMMREVANWMPWMQSSGPDTYLKTYLTTPLASRQGDSTLPLVGQRGVRSAGLQANLTLDYGSGIGVASAANYHDAPDLNPIIHSIYRFFRNPSSHEFFSRSGRQWNLGRFEGIFSMDDFYVQIVEVGGRLVRFMPFDARPMDSISVYRPNPKLGKGWFSAVRKLTTSSYRYGEPIQFSQGKAGDTTVRIGSDTLTRSFKPQSYFMFPRP